MADKEKETEEAEKSPETNVKKKGGKILFLALPVVGAVLGAVVTMAIPKPHDNSRSKHDTPVESHLDFSISEIKANLARAGGLHFAGVDIHIQLKTSQPEHVAERLGIKPAAAEGGHGGGGGKKETVQLQGTIATAVRDRIIMLFNAKSIDDLEGREKKEMLKREIKDELDPLLFPDKDGEIEAVLFKELLIQ